MELKMNRLKILAGQLDIQLSDEQLEQFQIYYDMLIEKNKVMNLTAITQLDEVITKHFLDSIALASVYQNIKEDELKIIDLGTGAGFPGLKITLMDSLNKRIVFLQSVIEKLQLSGIEAIHGRAEEMAKKKEYRETYDLCVSRAVSNLSTLSEYCLPFVRIDGKFISYKASEIEEELENSRKAIKLLGGKLSTVNKITLPESDIQRSFVIIDKIEKTSKTYPRKPGTAAKEPIK